MVAHRQSSSNFSMARTSSTITLGPLIFDSPVVFGITDAPIIGVPAVNSTGIPKV
jgi:hypothetical protein